MKRLFRRCAHAVILIERIGPFGVRRYCAACGKVDP